MLKYTGDGEFIIGPDGLVVPPRDLTDDEARTHKAAIDLFSKNTGRSLYAPVQAAKPADPAKE